MFYRGLVLKCKYCRATDWFPLDALSNEYLCNRCNRSQVITDQILIDSHKSTWFYKLDEIAYQGFSHDMIVPLLALDRIAEKCGDTFLWAPELELYRVGAEKPELELDICCIADGVLTIGEAKKADRLAPEAKDEREAAAKYHDVARELGARRVVFATLAPKWRDSTKALIEKEFAGSRAELVFYHAVASHPGPA